MPVRTHLVDLDREKWICFFARNSEGCQARILVLGLFIVGCPVPERSSLMLSAGREQAAEPGDPTLDFLFLSLKRTFELFQIELFPSLPHQYKNLSFLISPNPAVFLVCKVNKKSSQLFGSLGNFAVQENQTKHLNMLKLVRQQSDFLGT